MNKHCISILQLLSLLVLPFIMAPAIQAQSYQPYPGQFPQSNRVARFRWEGIVDGTDIIRVRRRQVQTEIRSGAPVQRERYEFTDPLPAVGVSVQLEVLEGRGRVQLLEQPRPNNDFAAVVRIEDSDRGASRYVFELRWFDVDRRDNDRRDNDRRDNDRWGDDPRYRDVESFIWRGRVDGESLIRINGNNVRVETMRGNGASNGRFNFSSSLPPQPTQVNLVDSEGRGEIALIEQPNQSNNYTAVVRIRDRDAGAGDYAFRLTWRRYNDRPRDDRPRDDDRDRGRGGLHWSGRVDGRDVINIRGNQLWIEHQAGGQITEANYRFESPLPNEQRTVTVRKVDGRGTVRVIEQPSRSNNFTAKILIDDENGGADRYEIEVSW